MIKIFFNTGNELKFNIASKVLKEYGVELIQKKIETPEIQAFDGEQISRLSAAYAAKKLNAPVLKTDVSYSIKALNGFPGPYIKFINTWLSAEDVLRLMTGINDRRVEIIEFLSYALPNGDVTTFKCVQNCRIADTVHDGSTGTTFDQLIIRSGFDIPQNMMSEQARAEMFQRDVLVWHDFGKYIQLDESKK